jgi:hypothetical protein
MNILKYLIAIWLCTVIINAHAKNLYQIKTSQGVLSLSKKNLSFDSPWVIKLDNKKITEFENFGQFEPSFMTKLGNSEAFYKLPENVIDELAFVDSEGEIMVAIDESVQGNHCDGTFVAIFFYKKNSLGKLIDLGECTHVNEISVENKKLILNVVEYKKPLVYESGNLKNLAVPAASVEPEYKDLNAAEKALKCVKADRGECPYFSEVYKGDSGFRESLDAALKTAGFTNPVLGDDSMDSPSTPIIISGESYIYDDTWRKFSESPGSDRVEVLYSLQQKRAVGLFYVEDSEKGKWFGNPTDLEKRVLDEAKNHSGSNPIGKAVSEGPYPVIVK